MRYCKNCGRELKDGARFCERCGKSVRQSRNNENVKKQEQIEKLQKERLERKRKQEQREVIENKRKERRREKRAKHGKVILVFLGIIAAIVIIALISYMATSKGSENAGWSNIGTEDTQTTALPTMQPSNTQAPVREVEEGKNDALSTMTNKDDFSVLELSNGMEIPYPEVFEKEETTGDEELNLIDEFGGDATMVVICEEYPGGTASGLMKQYAGELTGEVTDSLASGDRYTITVDDDGEITHRTYIIDRASDTVVYYDFIYNADSDYAGDYESYIDYIDEKFNY